jgi:hypothetical protein
LIATLRKPLTAWERSAQAVEDMELTSQARKIVNNHLARWANEPRAVVSRAVACQLSGCGPSHEIILEKRGELDAIHLDGRVMITTDSIFQRLIEKTIASHPLDGRAMARKPVSKNIPNAISTAE